MRLSKRFVSLFMAIGLLLCVFPAAAGAKSWQDEHPGQTTTPAQFVETTSCGQFDVAIDANTFGNMSSHFKFSYYLDKAYINQLLSVGNYGDQCSVLQMTESLWGGSCFGMASTMLLNNMTRRNIIADDIRLHISEFYPAAQNYIDLPIPRDNPDVLNLVNYYQIGQVVQSVIYGQTSGRDNTLSAGLVLSDGHMIFDRDKLTEYVNRAKASIDDDKGFLAGIYGSGGGHAIVGVDYYEYNENGKDYIIIKFYDENCVPDRPGRFCWIKLEYDGTHYCPVNMSGGNEYIAYHQYDETAAQPSIWPLSVVRHRDIDVINAFLNIHNPKAKSVTATNALLTVNNINVDEAYKRYEIKPVRSLSGGVFGTPDYVKNYGKFTVPGDNMLPVPVNAQAAGNFFPHMNKDELQYKTVGATTPSTPMNVQMSLNGKDNNNTDAAFQAYDVLSTSDMDVNMNKTGAADGNSQYASVSGTNLRLARFTPDGTLRYLKGPDGGQATDVSLYFGSKSMSGDMDMFKLSMKHFGFLKIYSGADTASYADSVVLHSDGFPFINLADPNEVAMGFTFYKGALLSDEIKGGTDTDKDTWIKIKSQVINGKVEISVWTDSEPTEGNRILLNDNITYGAPFNKEPDYTTILHERSAGSSSGAYDPDAYQNENHYSLVGVAGDLSYNGGDFRIRTNGPAEGFISVGIDGVMVERQYVTQDGDSVIIAEAFMKTLKNGTHTLRIQYRDGYLKTTFSIGALSLSAIPAVPATGGRTVLPFVCLGAAILLAVVVLAHKKK